MELRTYFFVFSFRSRLKYFSQSLLYFTSEYLPPHRKEALTYYHAGPTLEYNRIKEDSQKAHP